MAGTSTLTCALHGLLLMDGRRREEFLALTRERPPPQELDKFRAAGDVIQRRKRGQHVITGIYPDELGEPCGWSYGTPLWAANGTR